jgi:hypothetical protein
MGIKIGKDAGRNKTYEQELRENEESVIRREIADGVIDAATERENRIKFIIRDAAKKARNGVYVALTQEMVDLGIAEKVAGLNNEAELKARVNRFFSSDDDDGDDSLPSSSYLV